MTSQLTTGSRELTEAQRKKAVALSKNLGYYSKAALKIATKSGDLVPFVFNKSQCYIHARLEEQKAKYGRVRALILKGRQQGSSTYVGGRFYHKTSTNRGQSTFILSHEADTTQKLFKMVDRFYEHTPRPIRPEISASNRKQLIFKNLESQYTVGTAGNDNVGRGGTLQNFHGSEVAFWPKTEGIQSGILQSVADLPNTEIILESTANGMGNMFYDLCMDAMDNKGDYMLIFVPWFWQDEYRRPVPPDFEITDEESTYKKLYGLDDEQIVWRRAKTIELKSDWLFKQEYPANPLEAFQTSGNSLILPEKIMAARKANITDKDAPLILGVDPAREGDKTALVWRRGRVIEKYKKYESMNEMLLAGIIAHHLQSDDVDHCFVDVGLGYGTVDRLVELGYAHVVTGVHFGSAAIENKIYRNKRAEMGILFRDWIHGGGVSIPDDDEVHRDISIVPDFKRTSNGLIILESKDKIREDFKMSTDFFDAAGLTFAFPVANKKMDSMATNATRVRKKSGGLKSLRSFKKTKHKSSGGQSFSIDIRR